jgi:hypothetical protein
MARGSQALLPVRLRPAGKPDGDGLVSSDDLMFSLPF